MTQWLGKLVDDRKGNVFALYALAVPVILFAVGFAVDFGLAAQLRTRSMRPPTPRRLPR